MGMHAKVQSSKALEVIDLHHTVREMVGFAARVGK
jgi:hypothetical protein